MTNEDTQYLNVDYEGLGSLLLTESTPLAERFRALFSLKAVKDDRSVDIIAKGNRKNYFYY
jgi:deoxyhypusine monooxygenase